MRLQELRIENFRAFEDETIRFEEYTCFVGPNGAGKSTVLMALNVFFRNQATVTNVLKLSEEDFHHRNTKKPIKITLTFTQLTPDEQKEWSHYYRQNQLVLFAKAEWNQTERYGIVIQHGSRMVMNEFSPFFAAVDRKEKVSELKSIYAEIRGKYPILPSESTKDGMTTALRTYEESHPEACEMRDDPAELYGYTKGTYKLDESIKWIYIPAVKDASTEQEEGGKTALGALLDRTIRAKVDFSGPLRALKANLEKEYEDILAQERGILSGLKDTLERRLRDWAHPGVSLDLDWSFDPEKSLRVEEPVGKVRIGEDGFLGDVARLGHGMQRAFLVSILQELASSDQTGGPTLLLGIEEPELYQHPPQARHMARVLRSLAEETKNNTQVVVTTHSPYFVDCSRFPSVRMVRKVANREKAHSKGTDYSRLATRLANALGEQPQDPSGLMVSVVQIMQPSQSEMFFASVPVLVEGVEDVAYLATQMELANQTATFRKCGCHFVIAGGKPNMSRLLAIAKELELPAFAIFDADGNKKGDDRRIATKDNTCLLKLLGLDAPEAFPSNSVMGHNYVQWAIDIGHSVSADFPDNQWAQQIGNISQSWGISGEMARKKEMVITAALEQLSRDGRQSQALVNACSAIIRYAESVRIQG